MIEAHESPLAALAFTYDGTKLATASEKVVHPNAALTVTANVNCLVDCFRVLLFECSSLLMVQNRLNSEGASKGMQS